MACRIAPPRTALPSSRPEVNTGRLTTFFNDNSIQEKNMRPLVGLLAASLLAASAQAASARDGERWVVAVDRVGRRGPTRSATRRRSPICGFAFPLGRDRRARPELSPDRPAGPVGAAGAAFRFSNALGTRPVTFDGVHVGLQQGAATLVPGEQPAGRLCRRACDPHGRPGGCRCGAIRCACRS